MFKFKDGERIFSLRKKAILTIILLSTAFLFGGCSALSQRDGYIITGYVKLTPRVQYDITNTLRLLCMDDVDIVIAKIRKDTSGQLYFSVQDNLVGNMREGEEHVLTAPLMVESGLEPYEVNEPLPENTDSVLLFLKPELDGYRPLIDETLWLAIDIDTIQTKDGIVPLQQARYEISQISDAIVLPSYFYFYNDLDQLVQASDNIFVGTLVEKRPTEIKKFSVSHSTIRQNISGESNLLYIEVDPNFKLKGRFPEDSTEIQVLNAPLMLDNTVFASSMSSVKFEFSDASPLNTSQPYLFFLVDPPTGGPNAPKYFVNCIQGYVPFSSFPAGDITWSNFHNPAFTSQLMLEDVIWDIESIISGEATSEEYPGNLDQGAETEYTDEYNY